MFTSGFQIACAKCHRFFRGILLCVPDWHWLVFARGEVGHCARDGWSEWGWVRFIFSCSSPFAGALHPLLPCHLVTGVPVQFLRHCCCLLRPRFVMISIGRLSSRAHESCLPCVSVCLFLWRPLMSVLQRGWNESLPVLRRLVICSISLLMHCQS